jgi:hypothetical protein
MSLFKQHFLYFFPLPQEQGWFLRLNGSSLVPRGSIMNAAFLQQTHLRRSLRLHVQSIRWVVEGSADSDGNDLPGIFLLEQWLYRFKQN